MSLANAALPADLDDRHVLALPAGTDVAPLATAWFPAADWVRHPVTPEEPPARSRPARGARFRGAVVDVAPPLPGLLRLDDVLALSGPVTVDAQVAGSAGMPARDHDLYTLVPSPAHPATDAPTDGATDLVADPVTEPPAGPSLDLALGWFTAVARRAGGVILPADRSRVVTPDPGAAVDLTLWSAQLVPADDLLPLVRPALSGARTAAVDVPAPPGTAPAARPAAVVGTYEYDGAVRVATSRSTDVPVALAGLSWRDYGPWVYRVTWVPTEPVELEQEHPSHLHQIARARVAPAVARATAALQRAVGGTVVDGGGFVVTPDELAARAAATTR